jgi:O-antigen/teichoic acid export membrane protein
MNEVALEHRAAKVSLVNGVSTILAIFFQLVSVPVCLHFWGKEKYGNWLALLSAYMLIRGLDAGYGAFVGNKLNYLYHKDTGALRKHLSSAVYGICAVSFLQLALTAGTFILEPLSNMLGIRAESADALQARLGLLALVTTWAAAGSYLAIACRLLIPAGFMYETAWWVMAFPVCQFAVVMVSATLNLDLLKTGLLAALAQTLISVAFALYVHRALPRFTPWLAAARIDVGLRDLWQSLPLTASNLIQQGSISGSVLMVSILAGPTSVPVFTTVRTMALLWNSVTGILSGPLLPDVVRLHANGEAAKLAAINQAYWVLAGTAVNLGVIISYPAIPFLYRHWTVHTVVLNQPLLCLVYASVVITNAGGLMAVHLNGINSLRIVLSASMARAILGLGIGALGFRYFGLASVGIGILAAEIMATLITILHFVKHELGGHGSRIAVSAYGPVGLSSGAVLLFFIGAALGWWSVGTVWLLTIACVAAASLWGWNQLDSELRERLKYIPMKLLGR